MASIFTKIRNREIPGHIIHEDADHMAILDINPNAKGHALCIPRDEVNKIFDLSDEAYRNLMAYAKKIAVALEKAVPCKRIGMAVVGLEVPHVHVHLIPLQSMDDMRFTQKTSLTEAEFKVLLRSVQEHL